MIQRRPLGTGPRPTTDVPAAAGPRARLAAELAAPAAENISPAGRSAAAEAPGRRRLGSGTTAAGH
ncbi:hypothetical protein [Streptomyces sp. NPDC001717]|uniref:hypothetical protein n=1 Tax=Streptomyces sp. NPDC001717 TaxID=3364604 RepID=UPI003683DDCC